MCEKRKFAGSLAAVLLAAGALVCAVQASEPVLDGGGVSVDFRKFHDIDPVDSDVFERTNLIPNGVFKADSSWVAGDDGRPKEVLNPAGGWSDSFWYYTTKEPERSLHRRKLGPLGTRRLSGEDPAVGEYCFELGMSDVHSEKNEYGASFSNNLSINISNPDPDKNTNYILSFQYKAEYSELGGHLAVYIPFRGIDGSSPRRHVFTRVPGESSEWVRDQLEFNAPEGTAGFTIQFRFTGYGTVFIDDVFLAVDEAPRSVTTAVLPFSFIDGEYHLPSGQVGVLQISAKNAADMELTSPRLVLTLPEAIRVLGLRNGRRSLIKEVPVERGGERFIEHHIAYSMPRQIRQDRYQQSHGEFILLETELPPGDKLYSAECYFADGDFRGETRRFDIKVMEPVAGRRPELFKTGTHIWHEFTYGEPEALLKLSEFYAGAGFNVIQLGTASRPEMSAVFKEAGMYRYIQRFIVNGYTVYERQVGADMPEEAKYRGVDGEHIGTAICPTEIYRRGGYYTGSMEPAFRRAIVEDDLAESLMCNWEPFMFANNGCFCGRCLDEFIAYSGKPREEVEQFWPSEIAERYHDDSWADFRSWQHARLVVTLNESLSRIGEEAGKESYFIPEISNSFRRGDWPRTQYDPRDYMAELPVIQPWGPYIYHRFTRPYVYTPGRHLSLYRRAVEPVEFIESAIEDPGSRPELIAFPQGIQVGDWIQEPEAISFQTLCFFISGWDGSIPYFFPGGYDGRYFRAVAEANTLIADHEEVVFGGRRKLPEERFVMEVLSPLPELEGAAASGVEEALLQAQEYEYGDRRLYAVGNFWQRGDAWVRIRPRELPAGGRYVLREVSAGRVFANAAGSAALSADDLADGVTVHVGALRWGLFTLEPWEEGVDYGKVMTRAALERALEGRRAQLLGLAEEYAAAGGDS